NINYKMEHGDREANFLFRYINFGTLSLLMIQKLGKQGSNLVNLLSIIYYLGLKLDMFGIHVLLLAHILILRNILSVDFKSSKQSN
ncbi:hypothetical protein ACJX0J_028542, partial [Zea mays]